MDRNLLKMEKKLLDAANVGDVFRVVEILKECPDIDVNWHSEHLSPALHLAWVYEYHSIVTILLLHPRISFDADQFARRVAAFAGNLELLSWIGSGKEKELGELGISKSEAFAAVVSREWTAKRKEGE